MSLKQQPVTVQSVPDHCDALPRASTIQTPPAADAAMRCAEPGCAVKPLPLFSRIPPLGVTTQRSSGCPGNVLPAATSAAQQPSDVQPLDVSKVHSFPSRVTAYGVPFGESESRAMRPGTLTVCHAPNA